MIVTGGGLSTRSCAFAWPRAYERNALSIHFLPDTIDTDRVVFPAQTWEKRKCPFRLEKSRSEERKEKRNEKKKKESRRMVRKGKEN